MKMVPVRRSVLDKTIAVVADALGGFGERAFLTIASRGVNSKGGSVTIRNARVWTGHHTQPWADGITIENGRIVALDADNPAGKVVNAEGRLVVPGFHDGHCHPQVPYVLSSPEAPMLFHAKSVADVQAVLRRYVEDFPEDRYPRLFGYMSAIFDGGFGPTRQMLDQVVPDRPCYITHHSGHEWWANTKALELSGVLESDLPVMPATAVVRRDSVGLATGHLEETEYAGTDGILLRGVREMQPLSFPRQTLVQRFILEEYSKVGVTSIWTKDGSIETTQVYESLLEYDSLPVRVVHDMLFCPFNTLGDLTRFAQRAAEVRAAGYPPGFFRCDVVKLMLDLPTDTHQAWMFEPYADGIGEAGRPVFPLDDFRAQARETDRLGLGINLGAIGDRAVHEGLNILRWIAEVNPPRKRRNSIEHSEFVVDSDLARFRELDVVPVMNPIGAYPDMDYQAKLARVIGAERLDRVYQPWKRLLASGAMVVNGSDFPLAPMDPLVGMHILVNATDIHGEPAGGLWPHKTIGIEDALRTYTANSGYQRMEEDENGTLRVGHFGDIAMLSEDILAEDFERSSLPRVKAVQTVFNGHIVHEDFSTDEKSLDFGN